MANDCLIKKLKSQVDNSSLDYIYGISTMLVNGDLSLFTCGVDNEEKNTTFIELVGNDNAYFTDSTKTENYGRKITLPVGSSVSQRVHVKNASDSTKLRTNNYKNIFTWDVFNGEFDASLFQFMENLDSLIISRGLGVITAEGYAAISNSPVNNKFGLFYDGYSGSSSTNPGPISTFGKCINLREMYWGGATGSHESLVEALWTNGKRGHSTTVCTTIHAYHVTINNVECGKAVYYKFTNDGVTIYGTKNGYTLSEVLATYNGTTWSYA